MVAEVNGDNILSDRKMCADRRVIPL